MTSIPLRAVSSARPDPDGLVPRTPHSRSGRFDEADLGIPTGTSEDADSDGYPIRTLSWGTTTAQRNHPIYLHSPPTFKPLTNATRFSIIGLTVMLFLVFLAGVVYRKSEQEEEVYDHEVHGGHSNFTLISYENYTEFPLTPKQYRAECRKIHTWGDEAYGVLDGYDDGCSASFPFGSDSGVCKSTVTYMLGSEVGLMGDLALLAQVAALADSVSPWISVRAQRLV
jgi:hypothetical protein